jgi:S-adenosylmethionine:tRNA ribosyltransferase-isomerase
MDVRAFDFSLPHDLIAQEPAAERTAARLMVVRRDSRTIEHSTIGALPDFLRSGDLLVVNDTRVFPARLIGRRVPSGGAVECLLIRPLGGDEWEALMHPGQKLAPGARVAFDGDHPISGEVLAQRFFGRRVVRLQTDDGSPLEAAIDAIGHMPLPPYIKRVDRLADRERYQTVYARERGSVAAPTAGLHFTPALLEVLAARGVGRTAITLHVGYGTFQPVRVDRVEDHRVEAERFEVSRHAAEAMNTALDERRRIIAVGTTTTRTLEAVAREHSGRMAAGVGSTDLFIYPGFTFRVVGGLLTNFHLPKSSLLMLVSAFAGHDLLRSAYDAAVAERYRFYSYGDAMVIL